MATTGQEDPELDVVRETGRPRSFALETYIEGERRESDVSSVISRLRGKFQTFWRGLFRRTQSVSFADIIARDCIGEDRFLWAVFGLSAGIALYFILPEEPSLLAVSAIAGAGAFWWLRRFRRGQFSGGLRSVFLSFLVLISLGVAVAGLRVQLVQAPRLAAVGSFDVVGRIEKIEGSERGRRLHVTVEMVEAYGKALQPGDPYRGGYIPELVRISLASETELMPGARVSFLARLFPPSGAVVPGGYDFSFWAYFQGVGATGFVMGKLSELEPLEPGSLSLFRFARLEVHALRLGIAERLRNLLGDVPVTELVVALLVGERAGLDDETVDALRVSGLAHVLAISGLHMALFAGGVYAVLLGALALSEYAALRWPVHRLAAGGALLAASFYLLLSGASIATQRSFLMISLVFLGVLVGRRGLSLRSVALAGGLLLLVAPEQLLHPGFQMSFAAVLFLVGFYGRAAGHYGGKYGEKASQALWQDRLRSGEPATKMEELSVWWQRFRSPGAGPFQRGVGVLVYWGAGLFLTSLLAGLATGVVGAHHFGRVAPFGLLGNLLAMPVFTFLVMPFGALAIFLMPFGLAAVPLVVMEFGLEVVISVARWVASLQSDYPSLQAASHVPPPSYLVVILMLAGGFAVLRFSGALRLSGCLVALLGAALWSYERPADILISDKGVLVAARDEAGILRLSKSGSSFVEDVWGQMAGVGSDLAQRDRMALPQMSCHGGNCAVWGYGPGVVSGGSEDGGNEGGAMGRLRISMPKTSQALAQDCIFSDIIVTDLIAPRDCHSSLVFDRLYREKHGSLALWLREAGKPQELSESADMIEKIATGRSSPRRP